MGEYYVGDTDPGLSDATLMQRKYYPARLQVDLGDVLPDPGTYTIHFRAYDQAGNWSSTYTTTVTITDIQTVGFSSAADTYVRSGSAHRNEGANTYMQLQASGDNRSLVKFD